MKKLLPLLLLAFGLNTFAYAQKTYIPDHHFEQALIDKGLDDVLDDSVLTANIDTVTYLNVSNKNISDLTGIESFKLLKHLICRDNPLSKMDISHNLELETLDYGSGFCRLTSLDVSHNTALVTLQCSGGVGRLTNLDLSNNLALENLDCGGNQLASLDVSKNTALKTLNCYTNQLTTLDVSRNTVLKTLDCGLNRLTTIDISKNTALKTLNCGGNQLSSLDVSFNNLLDTLSCGENPLTSLDVSHNLALTELQCSQCQISDLSISNNISLKSLICNNNNLSSIDVSHNVNLVYFLCYENQLTSLDVSRNTLLEGLDCHKNNLSAINLSNNTNLVGFSCYGNKLSSLDVSNNRNLILLTCQRNQLTSLDVSKNTALIQLACDYNQLTTLNVKNGNNKNFTLFEARINPNLTCIQVDDAAWSTANWPNKDATATYSDCCNCNQSKTYVPDDNFEQALIDLGLDDVLDDSVNTASIDTVTKLDVQDKNISDLTGIEDFKALSDLTCHNNQITSLDLSNNTQLINIHCPNNLLTSLIVPHNNILRSIDCWNNQLITLDVSNNPKLQFLNSQNNQLTTLNISNDTALHQVFAFNNKLKSVNLDNDKNPSAYFNFSHNQLVSLDLTKTNIGYLDCRYNQLTSLDPSLISKLQILLCDHNQILSLDVSSNLYLKALNCQNNNLTSLNVRNGNNVNYTDFNSYTGFDATNNPNLTCIQVDDAAWSTANWPNKDATATYSDHCSCCGPDTDGDGVPDSMDDYPNDSTRAFNNYFPATGFGTLAFEDLWPGKGDYDFNDVVVGYQFKTVTNASNKVVEIIGTIVAKASGASMRNGFGFNLPDASTTLCANQQDITVAGYSKKETYIRLNSNGLEKSQSKPTVIVFDDIFDILPVSGSFIGVNTNPKAPFVPFDTLTITITPVNTHKYTASDFSLETWNPFIIVNYERGKEVHLPDHAPTDLADPSYFKTMDDDSDPATGKYYKTEHNQPWAIDVVSDYQWPVEKVNIGAAYLHFVKWAETSGAEFPDWYKDKPGYRNESNIYVVPAK